MHMKPKNQYSAPELTEILLDNEMSLQLASDANPSGDPSGNGWD